jgi:hypothetical protein
MLRPQSPLPFSPHIQPFCIFPDETFVYLRKCLKGSFMTRRTWYILLLAGMVALYAFMCMKLDKFGTAAPATLCGAPVWMVTAIGLGLLLLGGTRYRPVVDPGEYGETPGCLFGMFIGFFLLAMLLGVYFTEPIVCTGRDGDVCYEYGTTQPTYQGQRYDGSSYRYTYRNNWVWISDPFVSSSVSTSGSWLADLDIDDSEAAIFIVLVIVLIIIVLSSAFIPNMWVLACALCIGATYLTILRLGNSEKVGKQKTDGGNPIDKPKKSKKAKKQDPLLDDPEPSNVTDENLLSGIDAPTPRAD